MARILIVDDDDDLQFTIGQMLRRTGHKVIEAANRADLDVLQEHHFDILLTDMAMPGLTGLEVIEILSKRQTNIKIIAMSGDTEVQGVGPFENIIEFGAQSFIRKPFGKKQLLAVIDTCLKDDRGSAT